MAQHNCCAYIHDANAKVVCVHGLHHLSLVMGRDTINESMQLSVYCVTSGGVRTSRPWSIKEVISGISRHDRFVFLVLELSSTENGKIDRQTSRSCHQNKICHLNF